MDVCNQERTVSGYVELASPQLLDDTWRELNFDLATGHNVLQDLVVPESGSGYVYRDAKKLGTATHNRFIYWRINYDVLELVEISPEVTLDGCQVRIRFANSPVINDVTVIEFADSIAIMIATVTSVHRIHLPHPKTTNKSVLFDLTTDVLFNPANYYILSNSSVLNNQHPICAASWHERSLIKCALSFPDSSLLVVQFGHQTHHVSTYDIKQTGIIGRLWSRMPNLLAKHPNDCDNAVFVCTPYHHIATQDVLLFTLCRDCKIRVFSNNSRECLVTHNMIPQSSFSQSYASHTNPTTELPMMKVFDNKIVIYLIEARPEFVVLTYSYQDGQHIIQEKKSIGAPIWEKLIDFSITDQRIWALASVRETESALCCLDLANLIVDDDQEGDEEGVWDYVNLADEIGISSVKNLVAEIFWRNRFSIPTIRKALVGIAGSTAPRDNTMESLEEFAYTQIVSQDQDEAWTKFYNYCLQSHHTANKNIGLVVSADETVITVVKRSNPSIICPLLMSVDMVPQGGPYRGIDFSTCMRHIIGPLDYISTELLTDDYSNLFERKLYESPGLISETIDELVDALVQSNKIEPSKLNLTRKTNISTAINFICEQLDITSQAKEFSSNILKESQKNMKSEHNPLGSSGGIILTFELFRRMVQARMNLARDLLIYINIMNHLSASGEINKSLVDLCEDLHTSRRVLRIKNALRCYSLLAWIADTPIKTTSVQLKPDIINFISEYFQFFKSAPPPAERNSNTLLDTVLSRNLFMNFLAKGGVNYSCSAEDLSSREQTLSNSYYVTDIALNLCKLLWPENDHLCLAEFLFTHQLDEHLAKYLDLTENRKICIHDKNFIRAANCLLQNRTTHSVEIFNKLWMHMKPKNLIGRFISMQEEESFSADEPEDSFYDLSSSSVPPTMIYRYYDKLIQLFQIYNDQQCLVNLINNCISRLDVTADKDQQQWVNCFRAKLFQYYLELGDSDEAYHTMVLTTDGSLRYNCLRKFVVFHCEHEQWSNLLSYPFIDIKHDFIDVLNQKASSSDLSKLNEREFYRTTYYDILFAHYISDDEYKRAAKIMYRYAERLAQEVPGVVSIKKQVDCLLIALNTLRCVESSEASVEANSIQFRDEGRSSVLKRAHDSEQDSGAKLQNGFSDLHVSSVTCRDIEMKYELTRARLQLLEKDQTANAIALSPLRPEETIAQLVASSLFPLAIDLALMFRSSMDLILEGLASKYVSIMRLSAVDIALHQDLERDLSDIFNNSYSNIDTYNFIANSTSPLVDKLWRLIDYYLTSYDGVSHRYKYEKSVKASATTVLMRIVADRILSAGYDIPASLRRMYMTRNTPELLKLLMKYDKLTDAADLAIEMMERVMEPSSCFAFTSPLAMNDPPPIYLPTHLILLLISFLNEDATNTKHVKTGIALEDKLEKFRRFVKSS